MKLIFVLTFILVFSTNALADSHDKYGEEQAEVNLSGWGFDIGFGNQPYMEDVLRIGLQTPYLFSFHKGSYKLNLSYTSRELMSTSFKSFAEVALSLEGNRALYKNLAYSYTRIGIGL